MILRLRDIGGPCVVVDLLSAAFRSARSCRRFSHESRITVKKVTMLMIHMSNYAGGDASRSRSSWTIRNNLVFALCVVVSGSISLIPVERRGPACFFAILSEERVYISVWFVTWKGWRENAPLNASCCERWLCDICFLQATVLLRLQGFPPRLLGRGKSIINVSLALRT